MKGNRVLTFARKCKSILESNWQGHLNTIKADAKGRTRSSMNFDHFPWPIPSPEDWLRYLDQSIHTNLTIFSLSVSWPESAAESLEEVVVSEKKAIGKSNYTVSGVLSSSDTSGENLKELLEGDEKCTVYEFNPRSCVFINGNGGTHDVDLEDMHTSKSDQLAPFSAKIIDGINQSEARRHALMLFCFTHLNANVKDVYIPSIDRKGFEVLGRDPSPVVKDGFGQYQWKECRFSFKEEARDVESLRRHTLK